MFQRMQRTITIAVLGSYLLMVTAASQIHRCHSEHASSSPAPASEACAHGHMLRGEFSGPTHDAGIAPSRTIVAVPESNHHEADCFVCQMLAQKYVAVGGPGHVLWAQVAHESPVAEPHAAASPLLLPWHIRAPPSAA